MDGLDLDAVPLSLPGSRLFLTAEAEGVVLHSAEYERSRTEIRLLEAVKVLAPDGVARPLDQIEPGVLGWGAVTLTFAGERTLSVGTSDGAGVRLRARIPSRMGLVVQERHDGVLISTDLRVASRVWVRGARLDGATGDLLADGPVTIHLDEAAPAPAPASASSPRPDPAAHQRHLATTRATWAEWLARCPRVREDLAPMAALCWYVLGANTVRLGADGGGGLGVVPALRGYAGVWQWDAYFIASGLRHGAAALAAEQLDLMLGTARPDGQLVDVVHDDGVLASSDDLPPGDLENLRRLASPAADPNDPVALTKPPLAAWALARLADGPHPPEPAWLDRQMERVLASQRWWFATQDTDGDGLPEYTHPYSSGLDDSPVFDAAVPLTSPDLAAYLVVQDQLLADWARRTGRTEVETECQARRTTTRAALLGLWDGTRFRARGHHGTVGTETILELLPLFIGDLPADLTDAVVGRLGDHFATPVGVPTVATDDPDFNPDQMWRGPSWVSTSALLALGLQASGRPDEARRVAEATVAMVVGAGGPHEYVNPVTGDKPPRAVTAFSWSAALYVDLAVALTEGLL